MASIQKTLREAIGRLGVFGFLKLIARKLVKRQRYRMMLREVPRVKTIAKLRPASVVMPDAALNTDSAAVIAEADRLLADHNHFFSFEYHLRGVEGPWEYDPLEKKHWPHRHYTEQKLHAEDTPRDVKIVWEINRFVDLPTIAQAAFLTRDERYAREIESRLISWIEENPFAHSINWASALEIAIRLISWTLSLRLLQLAGFAVHENERIRRSVYEQLRYLSADLSIDKVVPTNHLIGEVAGLFVAASFWEYPTAGLDRDIARKILETEIIRQTFPDGATLEATSWYHQFVTGFFDLAYRTSVSFDKPLTERFSERLASMKSYLNALTFSEQVVRYGDADEGLPIKIVGSLEKWLGLVFGAPSVTAKNTPVLFDKARQAALRVGRSYLFVRAGEFGMGGAGFSSHAHDDLLSPIVFLDGLPVLADPGTYVYNGAPEERRKYRGAEAHNGLVIGSGASAVQRMNFGWHVVRPEASLKLLNESSDRVVIAGSYAEWPWHERTMTLEAHSATVKDAFRETSEEEAHWYYHLHPRWKPEHQSETEYRFIDDAGNVLSIKLEGNFQSLKLEHYDYSPSYRVKEQAFALELHALVSAGAFGAYFRLDRHS